MNGRKKLLCVFLLAAFLFCYTSVNAFAEGESSMAASSSGESVPASPPENGDKPVQGNVSSSVSQAPPSKAPSSAAASSKAASSSPKKKKKRASVSSAVSSAPESLPFDGFGVSSEAAASGVISLPEAGVVSENDPLASAADVSSKKMTQIGLLAWVCIALGVLVVLIVILSNRRPPRGRGRSRYHRPNRGGGKHLLNDKYYRGLNRY